MSLADQHPFPLLVNVDWHPTRAVRRLMTWCRQECCALRGHETVFHFEPTRLSLVCLRCGMQTTGWDIDVRAAFRSVTSRRGSPLGRPRLVRPLVPTGDGQGPPELPNTFKAA